MTTYDNRYECGQRDRDDENLNGHGEHDPGDEIHDALEPPVSRPEDPETPFADDILEGTGYTGIAVYGPVV